MADIALPDGRREAMASIEAADHMIVQLSALADEPFAEALADCIMDPEPTEQAAFRSEALAFRSLAASRYLIDNVNSQLRRADDESKMSWAKRAEHFRNRVGMERRLLDQIVAGLRASRGILPNAPNPRGRAMRRLWTENLAGDVAKGRARELYEEEVEADRVRIKREKEERKAAGRAAKAEGRMSHLPERNPRPVGRSGRGMV